MIFLVQLKKQPEKFMIIRATNRLAAFTRAKLIDVHKTTWCLENFDHRTMLSSLQSFELK